MSRARIASTYIRQLRSGLPICNEAAIAKGELWLIQRTWVLCVE